MILTYIIDIDETLKLTQGLGHKMKGQGHIGIYVKKYFGLELMDVFRFTDHGCSRLIFNQ